MIGALAFLSPRRIMYGIAAAAVAGLLWFGANFVDSKYEAEAAVTRLEQVVADQEDALQILKREAAQKESAQRAADAARAELEALRETYDEIDRDAASVKDEDDAEVAPVLRRTLDALGRM